MIVVDASVIVELLLRDDDAVRIERRLFRSGETLHAPHLLDVEVAQVLRRYARLGEIGASDGAARLAILGEMPIRRYPQTPLLSRIWQLRESITAYDAAYVALAEALRGTLVTRDAKLATAPTQAVVEVI